MSRTYSKPTDKQNKQPKVHIRQYIYSLNEPDDLSEPLLATENQSVKMKSTKSMRQRFRIHLNKIIKK